MIIFLGTILVIALCFIFAGLLLSSRPSEPSSHAVPHTTQSSTGSNRTRSTVRRSSPSDASSHAVQYTTHHGTRNLRTASTVRRSAPAERPRRRYREVEQRYQGNVIGSLHIDRWLLSSTLGRGGPWIGITLILIALFIFSFSFLRTLQPGSAMLVASSWPDAAAATTPQASTVKHASSGSASLASFSGASQALIRVYQLDRAQYNSQQDYDSWAYSACSAAAMTAIFNAYGHQYRVADVLKVEAGIHEITPDLGLIEPVGIDRTAAKFGFQTYWLSNSSLDDLLKVANQGHPVIIGFPPDRWSGGHILIVRGGDSQSVFLADSSRLNMQTMPRSTFMKYWAGFAAVVTPQ